MEYHRLPSLRGGCRRVWRWLTQPAVDTAYSRHEPHTFLGRCRCDMCDLERDVRYRR